MPVGLSDLGVAVPERTLLATLSDSESARRSRPAITALELNPTATMNARRASLLVELLPLVDLLQARIAGLPSAGPILTNTRLRVRASSRRAEAPH
ncbi:substrate-binding domain-containing protein [Nocardioides nematodiphilus]|uniref:substrate-binding domain-containing protein n=1 Tax=Nocardioides nematodiphilus TaxID=2849669 RepID=UPI001CD98E20|nr:substrate-binding domain-containing protein [Nocardioides nematodiphilus]MCA1982644.1 substrate-binding domain-containing protein [Nocardioides nematodiphilus]